MLNNHGTKTFTDSNVSLLLTAVAWVIGVDCAVNAWYFMSDMPFYISALPIFSGFLLNFILYRKDVESMKKFFKNIFNSSSFDSKKTAVTLIALMNGFVMFMFTYQSYMSLMQVAQFALYVPTFIPVLCCAAYAIGTIALLYDDIEQMIDSLTFDCVKVYLQSLFNDKHTFICFILGVTNTLLITSFSFYTAVCQSFMLLPFALQPFCYFMFGCFVMTEAKFSVSVFDTYLASSASISINKFELVLLTLANAVANGFITMGDANLKLPYSSLVFGIGATASYATMINSAEKVFYFIDNEGITHRKEFSKILGLDELSNHCHNIIGHIMKPTNDTTR